MAETFFYRSKKERSYTVVDNTFIRDERLSWKAKGLMTYLLSLPEDWKIYMKEIVNHSSDGEAGLRSAIKELTKYGYIKFERKRNKKGVFMQGIYKIIENPHLENPNVDNPDLENRTLLNTNKQITDRSNISQVSTDLLGINNKADRERAEKEDSVLEWLESFKHRH
jgi:hypothetical protein